MLEAAIGKCKIKGHTYTNYGQKELYKRTERDTRNQIYTSLLRPVLEHGSLLWDPYQHVRILVRPVLEHGSLLWDPYQQVRIQQIEAVHNKAARYVHQDWQRTSSVAATKEALGWLSHQNRRLVTNIHAQTYAWTTWVYATTICKPANTTYHKHTYTLIRAQTDVYLYSYLPKTIKAWNSLPSNISNRIDIDSFLTNLSNDMRNGNVQVVGRSIATNQARGGSGATTLF